MITTERFDFVFIPGWYEHLDALAKLTLPEPWRYRAPPPERRNTRTPEMAYTNARLLGVPTATWLKAVVE